MESVDTSQIGRYGTISLLKRQDPSIVVTAFGIDTEQLTFGCDRECGVRLYYPDVDPVHCKIVFEERKAFLIVLGQHGLLVDGCLVYPNTTGAPMTIPLTNNSEIEIHGKRFRFTYPPKQLRAVLFASPIRINRAPRLSMINSAQVFSPRPSRNSEENLRVLQSPLRNNFLRSPLKPSLLSHGSSSRSSSPVRQPLSNVPQPSLTDLEEEVDDEDIILVEGNHPQVVEEEKDLVILEDVKVSSISSDPASPFSIAQHHAQPFSTQLPQTPSRARSNSRNSLHRAVLMRSVQRAVLRAEKEQEDEMEEIEVLSAVASDEDFRLDDMHEHEQPDENFIDENVHSDLVMDADDHDMKTSTIERAKPRGRADPTWRFQSVLSKPEGDASQNVQFDDNKTPRHDERLITYSTPQKYGDGDRNLENEDPTVQSPKIAMNKNFGAFLTPQPRSRRHPPEIVSLARNLFDPQDPRNEASIESEGSVMTESKGMRFSVGGGEPRRMLVEMPWRVKDLIIPPKAEQHYHTSYLGELEDHSHASARTPRASGQVTPKQTRRMLDDQERKAIQERRRSALRDADTFFVGGIPGMGVSPTKSSTSPVKQSRDPSVTPRRLPFSQDDQEDKRSIFQEKPDTKEEDDDDEVDTRCLLERMKVTVEEMKRRRSTLLVPQVVPDVEKGKLSVTEFSLPASTGIDEDDELWGKTELATQKSEGAREKPSSNLGRSSEQRRLIIRKDTKAGTRETSTESSEEIDDDIVEKSFSQLMRPESPVDIERSSDDIRDILEQDITIPSDFVNEPTSSEVPVASTHTARIGTRTRGRNASAEPELALPTNRRGPSSQIAPMVSIDHASGNDDSEDGSEENSAQRSESGTAIRTPTRGRGIISETAINVQELEPEDGYVVDQQETEEEGREVRSIPAPRAKRGRPLRAAASAPARRTRTVASTSRPKPIEMTSDSGEEPLNSLDRQARATTARRARAATPKGKGRPRKVKEEPDIPVAVKNSRVRSATTAVDNIDGRRSLAATKTPVTRASGRRTPATAPSGVSVVDEPGNRDKRRTKAVPEEGVRVKMTRNRKAMGSQVPPTSKNTATTRIKVEENEDEAPRRNTRARTRTKTQ